jgi:hypothetical protein
MAMNGIFQEAFFQKMVWLLTGLPVARIASNRRSD